ncbi:hypothetical protein BLA9940_02309 [Burkholderia aenigmatica]|uniref:hypothetical protein n=1 Tax=Burkholderia aenigmatica TaxID=2015348 RepID=UPI001454A740|nr:hypothetical protein [Burkholderia aenigmatica]VWC55443.1 hypothetical protein BLA9940_02309 [Burkholderia aenigmatica]
MNTVAKRFLLVLATLMACVRGGIALAETASDRSFSPEPNIPKVAEAYSLDAVDFSAKQFGIKLDWSDASVANVEKALAQMSSSYVSANPRPTDEQVMAFAKVYGSYVGEVYRRNHGGEWGVIALGGRRFPGLRTTSGSSFWPWGRVFHRITKGTEDNIADYYAPLLKK